MGDLRVRKIVDAEDRKKMYQHAINDIEAFEWMLREKVFDTSAPKIGAEQEICLTNPSGDPAITALKILDKIGDQRYTNELALFNLEINLDPLPLSGECFGDMEKSLRTLLKSGSDLAADFDTNLLLTGILPTLQYRHLQFEYMTPIQRYQTLSNSLSELRGSHFEIYLQGVDEFIMSLGSVLFEACNTSFQLHLQIHPDEFADRHNWSQMIAGPVLSACVNSPLLFGNELWAETRIALFKQSLDTRSSQRFLRKKLPRVYFGKQWLQSSPAELWKNDLMRFPLLVTSDDLKDSKEILAAGGIPDLRGIRLHNGTTYTWNRLCYGFSQKAPHLRIECRYLPAGPTSIDEIANFAMWIGLMNSEPPEGTKFWKNQPIKTAKNNFVKAARTGLQSVFGWFGKNRPAKELLLEDLIPAAAQGLSDQSVAASDIEKYLGVFRNRVEKEITGAGWQVESFRTLSEKYGSVVASRELVQQMLEYQKENIPVHEWEPIKANVYKVAQTVATVEQLMSTDIFSIHEDDSVAFAKIILSWNNIHHLPVENYQGDLVGLITDGMIQRLEAENGIKCQYARDVMLTDLITADAQQPVQEIAPLFAEHHLTGLPVVINKKLVGIITKNDLQKKLAAIYPPEKEIQ